MASIIVGMETDQVAIEDAEEDLASDGKDTVAQSNLVVPRKQYGPHSPVNLGARERCMQEETNFDFGENLVLYLGDLLHNPLLDLG